VTEGGKAALSAIFSDCGFDGYGKQRRRYSKDRCKGALVDEGNASTATPSSAAATHDLQIGANGNSGERLLGTISELILYPSDQTANRERIEGDLAWYY
jgi:hypothetical protein